MPPPDRPLPRLPLLRQVTGWTKKLPKYVPWLTRDSPYYNLISDESQIWQGAWGRCRAEPRSPARPSWPARWPPARPSPCRPACPCGWSLPSRLAELNLAYSQHEIVSDYVRPTLM